MCGRYASSRRPEDLITEFEVDESRIAEPLAPDYNIAPTKDVYAVLERPVRAEEAPGEPTRQLRVLSWGLVPSWAKDRRIGSRLINARVETVGEKPAFRKAFAVRRCLLPADGYYEWYAPSAATPDAKPRKQPFFIRPRDHRELLAMAGLYEIWRDPTREADDPNRFSWTCTVLTTTAADNLGQIHERMPLMVSRDNWSAWLAPASQVETVRELLVPAAPGQLEAYPVSTLVSNVRNNGPELIAPIPLETQFPSTTETNQP